MQRSFEEGIMCGLLMDYDNKTSSSNYKRLSDPVLEYVLNNAILNLEIELTSHYTYKRYYGYLPKMEDPNRKLFINFNSVSGMYRINSSPSIDDIINWSNEEKTVIIREDRIPRNENGMHIGECFIEPYKCLVWLRDNIPIVALLYSRPPLGMQYLPCFTYTDKYQNVAKEVFARPSEIYKNLKYDDIPYLGKYKQTYKITNKGKIIFLSIDSIPDFSVKVTYEYTDTSYIRVKYPNNDYTVEPEIITSPSLYNTVTKEMFPNEVNKKCGKVLPDEHETFAKLITDLTIKEYNECQMELINQIYAENNTNYEFVRIKDYILPDELKPDKLPPELRYTT